MNALKLRLYTCKPVLLAILCTSLGAAFMSSLAKAQPNYLVPLPQTGRVIGLNNSGQVLYDTGLLTGNTFAAFPAGFTVSIDWPRVLGQSGVVAGTTTTGHLALYSAGTVTDLGLPPPTVQGPVLSVTPSGINASGQIVGPMGSAKSGVAFFYNGVMTDINSLVSTSDPLKSSVTIASVADINDSRMLLVVSAQPVVGSSTATYCRHRGSMSRRGR